MYESILKVLTRRLKLFFYGDRAGVSFSTLSRNTHGVHLNIESLIESENELPRSTSAFINQAENLFEEISLSVQQKQVTSLKWNAEKHLFTLLYCLVKALKPQFIVETGVANGVTTNAIMKAIESNKNNGVLHSFDILSETSKAYDGIGNWNFHLLKSRRTHESLIKEIEKLPRPDLWVHDSNHGYRSQKFEYLLAFKSLKNGGILISDDVDASSAWAEMSKTHFRKSFIIFDSRKFIGIAIK